MTGTKLFDAGDTVVLSQHGRDLWIGPVVRVTATQAIIVRGERKIEMRFRQDDGSLIGGDRWDTLSIRKVDAEEAARVCAEFRRVNTATKMHDVDWHKLTMAQLDAVSAIVNGMEPTQKEATR